MSARGEVLRRKRRQLRLVCLLVVPLAVCAMSAFKIWNGVRAGDAFTLRDVLVPAAMIGWSLVVYVAGNALLDLIERFARGNGRGGK
ncbi:hypothetical protein MTR62_10775 [Novosphingobium sp. 1949]|uniref:Uncharacterized protein n=1 Tax=Novosphingobium organovorum TaxID=2930092 RepID=A0ABT0BDM8_9SPHN|nr:hypothetical protein [Novosphingobium organovorum]MCJ2183172.1 hypothetical protein [Novosphingobium organovorum]